MSASIEPSSLIHERAVGGHDRCIEFRTGHRETIEWNCPTAPPRKRGRCDDTSGRVEWSSRMESAGVVRASSCCSRLRPHQVDFGRHGREAFELHVKGQLARFQRGFDPLEPLGLGIQPGHTRSPSSSAKSVSRTSGSIGLRRNFAPDCRASASNTRSGNPVVTMAGMGRELVAIS